MVGSDIGVIGKIAASRRAIRNWLWCGLASRLGRLSRHRLLPASFGQQINDRMLSVHLRDAGTMNIRVRDLGAIYDVFVIRGYENLPVAAEDLKTVIDCGANVGAFTRWIATLCECQVFAVEPGPASYSILQRNVAELGDRVATFRGAIGAERGSAVLYEPFYGANASLNPSRKDWDPGVESHEVDKVTLGDVLRMSGFDRVDLLKVDIEGAEQEIFATVPRELLDRVGAVMMECHPSLGVDPEMIMTKLRDAGMHVHTEGGWSSAILVASRDEASFRRSVQRTIQRRADQSANASRG